jgi:hypothetical protein
MTKLFPRKPGTTRDTEVAARAMAHRLLDALRRGERVTDVSIHWALIQTGDACPARKDHHGDAR